MYLRSAFRRVVSALDRPLWRLRARKSGLLPVLDGPETPLHTTGSENDIRLQVTNRDVSGSAESSAGRDCSDAFLGLAKTWRKLGVAFWWLSGRQARHRACPNVPRAPRASSAAAVTPADPGAGRPTPTFAPVAAQLWRACPLGVG